MSYLTRIKYLNYLVISLIFIFIIILFFKPISNEYPTGLVVPYYGLKAPSGWSLCDGKNGTPDLRGKFIMGANNQFIPGTYSGSFEKPKLPSFIDYSPDHTRIWGICKRSGNNNIHLYCEVNVDLMTTITSKKIFNFYFSSNIKRSGDRTTYLTNKARGSYFKNYDPDGVTKDKPCDIIGGNTNANVQFPNNSFSESYTPKKTFFQDITYSFEIEDIHDIIALSNSNFLTKNINFDFDLENYEEHFRFIALLESLKNHQKFRKNLMNASTSPLVLDTDKQFLKSFIRYLNDFNYRKTYNILKSVYSEIEQFTPNTIVESYKLNVKQFKDVTDTLDVLEDIMTNTRVNPKALQLDGVDGVNKGIDVRSIKLEDQNNINRVRNRLKNLPPEIRKFIDMTTDGDFFYRSDALLDTKKSNLDQSQIELLRNRYKAFRQEKGTFDVISIDDTLQQKLTGIKDVKSFTDEIFDPVSRLDDSGKSKEDVIIGILSVFDSMESSKQKKVLVEIQEMIGELFTPTRVMKKVPDGFKGTTNIDGNAVLDFLNIVELLHRRYVTGGGLFSSPKSAITKKLSSSVNSFRDYVQNTLTSVILKNPDLVQDPNTLQKGFDIIRDVDSQVSPDMIQRSINDLETNLLNIQKELRTLPTFPTDSQISEITKKIKNAESVYNKSLENKKGLITSKKKGSEQTQNLRRRSILGTKLDSLGDTAEIEYLRIVGEYREESLKVSTYQKQLDDIQNLQKQLDDIKKLEQTKKQNIQSQRTGVEVAGAGAQTTEESPLLSKQPTQTKQATQATQATPQAQATQATPQAQAQLQTQLQIQQEEGSLYDPPDIVELESKSTYDILNSSIVAVLPDQTAQTLRISELIPEQAVQLVPNGVLTEVQYNTWFRNWIEQNPTTLPENLPAFDQIISSQKQFLIPGSGQSKTLENLADNEVVQLVELGKMNKNEFDIWKTLTNSELDYGTISRGYVSASNIRAAKALLEQTSVTGQSSEIVLADPRLSERAILEARQQQPLQSLAIEEGLENIIGESPNIIDNDFIIKFTNDIQPSENIQEITDAINSNILFLNRRGKDTTEQDKLLTLLQDPDTKITLDDDVITSLFGAEGNKIDIETARTGLKIERTTDGNLLIRSNTDVETPDLVLQGNGRYLSGQTVGTNIGNNNARLGTDLEAPTIEAVSRINTKLQNYQQNAHSDSADAYNNLLNARNKTEDALNLYTSKQQNLTESKKDTYAEVQSIPELDEIFGTSFSEDDLIDFRLKDEMGWEGEVDTKMLEAKQAMDDLDSLHSRLIVAKQFEIEADYVDKVENQNKIKSINDQIETVKEAKKQLKFDLKAALGKVNNKFFRDTNVDLINTTETRRTIDDTTESNQFISDIDNALFKIDKEDGPIKQTELFLQTTKDPESDFVLAELDLVYNLRVLRKLELEFDEAVELGNLKRVEEENNNKQLAVFADSKNDPIEVDDVKDSQFQSGTESSAEFNKQALVSEINKLKDWFDNLESFGAQINEDNIQSFISASRKASDLQTQYQAIKMTSDFIEIDSTKNLNELTKNLNEIKSVIRDSLARLRKGLERLDGGVNKKILNDIEKILDTNTEPRELLVALSKFVEDKNSAIKFADALKRIADEPPLGIDEGFLIVLKKNQNVNLSENLFVLIENLRANLDFKIRSLDELDRIRSAKKELLAIEGGSPVKSLTPEEFARLNDDAFIKVFNLDEANAELLSIEAEIARLKSDPNSDVMEIAKLTNISAQLESQIKRFNTLMKTRKQTKISNTRKAAFASSMKKGFDFVGRQIGKLQPITQAKRTTKAVLGPIGEVIDKLSRLQRSRKSVFAEQTNKDLFAFLRWDDSATVARKIDNIWDPRQLKYYQKMILWGAIVGGSVTAGVLLSQPGEVDDCEDNPNQEKCCEPSKRYSTGKTWNGSECIPFKDPCNLNEIDKLNLNDDDRKQKIEACCEQSKLRGDVYKYCCKENEVYTSDDSPSGTIKSEHDGHVCILKCKQNQKEVGGKCVSIDTDTVNCDRIKFTEKNKCIASDGECNTHHWNCDDEGKLLLVNEGEDNKINVNRLDCCIDNNIFVELHHINNLKIRRDEIKNIIDVSNNYLSNIKTNYNIINVLKVSRTLQQTEEDIEIYSNQLFSKIDNYNLIRVFNTQVLNDILSINMISDNDPTIPVMPEFVTELKELMIDVTDENDRIEIDEPTTNDERNDVLISINNLIAKYLARKDLLEGKDTYTSLENNLRKIVELTKLLQRLKQLESDIKVLAGSDGIISLLEAKRDDFINQKEQLKNEYNTKISDLNDQLSKIRDECQNSKQILENKIRSSPAGIKQDNAKKELEDEEIRCQGLEDSVIAYISSLRTQLENLKQDNIDLGTEIYIYQLQKQATETINNFLNNNMSIDEFRQIIINDEMLLQQKIRNLETDPNNIQLSNEVDQIRNNVNRMRAILEREEIINNLQQRLLDAESPLSDKERQALQDKFNSEIQSKQAQLDKLKDTQNKQIQNKQAEIDNLQQQLKNARSQLSDEERQALQAQLNSAIQSKNDEITDLQQRLLNAETPLSDKERQALQDDFNSEIQSKNDELNNLRQQLKDSQLTNQQKQALQAQLDSEIQSKNDELNKLQQQLVDAESQLSDEERQALQAQLNSEIQTKQAELDQLKFDKELEMEQKQSEINDLQQRLMDAQSQLTVEERQELQNQLDKLVDDKNKDKTFYEEKIVKLNNAITSLQNELQAERNMSGKIGEELKQAIQQLMDARIKTDAAVQDLLDAEQKFLEDKKIMINTLNSELTEIASRITKVKNNINTLKRDKHMKLDHKVSLKSMYEPSDGDFGEYEINRFHEGKSRCEEKKVVNEDGVEETKLFDIVTGEECKEDACVVRKITELNKNEDMSDDQNNRKMLHPITVKYSVDNIAKMFKSRDFTYYLIKVDQKINRIEKRSNMNSFGEYNSNTLSREYDIDVNLEILDMKFVNQEFSGSILEFVIVRDNATMKHNIIRLDNHTEFVQKINVVDNNDDSITTSYDSAPYDLYIEDEYDTNNSRFYNYVNYDPIENIDSFKSNAIYSIGNDVQGTKIFKYVDNLVNSGVSLSGFVDVRNVESIQTNSRGYIFNGLESQFGNPINYFKCVRTLNSNKFIVSEFTINDNYEVYHRLFDYSIIKGRIQRININDNDYTLIMQSKGNNIFNDEITVNKALFYHTEQIKQNSLLSDDINNNNIYDINNLNGESGGSDYEVGETFTIISGNNASASGEVLAVDNGSVTSYQITEGGVGYESGQYSTSSNGNGSGLIIIMSQNDINIPRFDFFMSDVTIYSDKDIPGTNTSIILGMFKNFSIEVLSGSNCKKVVRTREAYSNMNKTFYLINNSVFSNKPLTGPTAQSTAGISNDQFDLQEIPFVLMGFTPSSDEIGGNGVNGTNLNEDAKNHTVILPSSGNIVTIEQLESTQDDVMIRATIRGFKCVGIWDAQYNLFKIYFFNPFMLTNGGFHYDNDYQIEELIVDKTMYTKHNDKFVTDKYIGLEDDGKLPDTKFTKWGNSNISLSGTASEPTDRISKYETVEDKQIRDSLPFMNEFEYMTGGDNIPDCYAMTYIIKN